MLDSWASGRGRITSSPSALNDAQRDLGGFETASPAHGEQFVEFAGTRKGIGMRAA
jgi:hypothetical protein